MVFVVSFDSLPPRARPRGLTHLIWELIPNRACSSGAKSWGRMVADRSFCIPACFPRRNEAILSSWSAVTASGVVGSKVQGLVHPTEGQMPHRTCTPGSAQRHP